MKKLEVLANVAVIISAVILCTVLTKNYLIPAKKQAANPQTIASGLASQKGPRSSRIQPGTKISLSGIEWNTSKRTVLLALSTTCHFCSESAPFYQRLQQEKSADVRLIALLPQSIEDSRAYLSKLGVVVGNIVQAPLASVGVLGTPTLLLVDSDGTVVETWRGKLPDEQATKVIARLNSPTK